MAAWVACRIAATSAPTPTPTVPEADSAPAMPRWKLSLPAATRTDCAALAPVLSALTCTPVWLAPSASAMLPIEARVSVWCTDTSPDRVTAAVPAAAPVTAKPLMSSRFTAVTASPRCALVLALLVRVASSAALPPARSFSPSEGVMPGAATSPSPAAVAA